MSKSTPNNWVNEEANFDMIPETENFSDNYHVAWKENEFYKQDTRTIIWYIGVISATILLCVGIFVVTKSILSVLVIAIMAVTFVVMSNRHPKEVDYKIHVDGIEINGKLYLFESFRSFTIIPERNGNNLQFLPVKRFMIPVTIFISDKQLDEIIELLTNVLPYEDGKLSYADKITKRIKF